MEVLGWVHLVECGTLALMRMQSPGDRTVVLDSIVTSRLPS